MAKTKKGDKKSSKTKTKEAPEIIENDTQEVEGETIEVEVTGEENAESPEEKSNDTPKKAPAELSEEQKDFRDMYIRLMAEFDNYRKRTQREKADLIRFGNKDLMGSLLPILDDLDRTLDSIGKTDNLTSVKDGINLVAKNISNVFSKLGVAPMDSKGKDFNSEYHEAISSVPMGEENEGKVIDVVKRGYLYKDQVARYAQVIVGE